ncbi:MAG: SDR family oxidoreductase [Gemmatimonadales bacterium]|nr:SDR family oxidoreductase [Gemmatimonadales bacterium]
MTTLAGRLALVTGGSRGIGAATARMLAAAGARVVRAARAFPGAAEGQFIDLPCDLTDERQVEDLAGRVLGSEGVPAVVVSNAGGFLLQSLEHTSPADFDAQIALNLRGSFLLARAFLPAMRDAGGGSFISVGSVADHAGFPENAAYAASKYGLRGLHETLVAEYRGTGVRLTLVSPGATDTTIWDPFAPERRPGFPSRSGMLRPEDVAEAILFAASRPDHVHLDWIRLQPSGRLASGPSRPPANA